MSQINLDIVRCEALFASTLQRCDDVDPDTVRTVIMQVLRELGTSGCAARVAQEFGDHPDTALTRMHWARGVVARLYRRDGGPQSEAPRKREPSAPRVAAQGAPARTKG
jgi:hypothetical protein